MCMAPLGAQGYARATPAPPLPLRRCRQRCLSACQSVSNPQLPFWRPEEGLWRDILESLLLWEFREAVAKPSRGSRKAFPTPEEILQCFSIRIPARAQFVKLDKHVLFIWGPGKPFFDSTPITAPAPTAPFAAMESAKAMAGFHR
eukprot:gene12912-biopygen7919